MRADTRTLLLGVSLGANAVLFAGLLGLLGLLLFGHTDLFSAAGVSTPRVPGALGSPTATSSASALTPAAGGGWLQIEPASVQVGCAADQQPQTAVLANTGPRKVRWQAQPSVPADQASVAVTPDHGELNAGASMPIQIQTQTSGDGQQSGASQQGVIDFAPTTPGAGPPASLTYITADCH